MTQTRTRLGILGGSGLYEIPGLVDAQEVRLSTPFGPPSDTLRIGKIGAQEVVFLARHGHGHRLLPSEVPYRANLWAMRALGCRWVLSVSAVGSLREDVAPGSLVLVDQFIDRTTTRDRSFFGRGVVAHVQFGDPTCDVLRGLLANAVAHAGHQAHHHGTYVVIDGPTFSTRAESECFRGWNADVIGMTNLPEARLAREAEMSYATLALVTDYDCWRTGHDEVSVDAILAVMKRNVAAAKQIVQALAPLTAAYDGPTPAAWSALRGAIMTDPHAIPASTRQELAMLLDPYLP